MRAQVTSGQVINLMSMDAGFLREIPRQLPRIPRCIVKASVGIALLVRLMGRGAVAAGVSIMVVFMPLGYFGLRWLDVAADKYAAKRDVRQGKSKPRSPAADRCWLTRGVCGRVCFSVGAALRDQADQTLRLGGCVTPACSGDLFRHSLTTDARFQGMKSNIAKTRREEMKKMFSFQIADHFLGGVWRVLPVASVLTTFGVFSLLGGKLTPQLTFTSLALLDEIRGPVLSVGEVVADLVRGWTAICRVSEFLDAEELDEHAVVVEKTGGGGGADAAPAVAIRVEDGIFEWGIKPPLNLGEDSDDDSDDDADGSEGGSGDEEEGQGERVAFRLESIQLSVAKGELIAVVGAVGAGKTSLLHALLGEMDCEGSPVHVGGSIAYASQSPFILNATLRENIAFGRDIDSHREHYDACLEACALEPDLKDMAKGDKTEIGESGETISGGQKQRLSLARTAFADADVVLLDDCLSAVDASVGQHIFQHCISNQGVMKGKTRILVTHALQYLPQCDLVLVMDGGRIVERGTLEELQSSGAPVLCALMASSHEGKRVVQASVESATAEAAEATDAGSEASGPASSSSDDEDGSGTEDGSDEERELTGDEDRARGGVKAGPIIKYIQAAGIPHSLGNSDSRLAQRFVGTTVSASEKSFNDDRLNPGMLGFFATDVGMQAISTYWLVWWGDDRFLKQTRWYMLGMSIISAAEILFIAGQQLLRSFSSIRASVRLHDGMINALLASPLSFFHRTPQGRIMHRFGDALEEIDDCFHLDLFEMVENGIRAFGTIIVCLTANPRFTVVLPILIVVFWRIHSFTKTGLLINLRTQIIFPNA